MSKRVLAVAALLSVIIFAFGGFTVYCEVENAVPQLNIKLNEDGSTYVEFIQQIEEEGADATIEQITQFYGEQGYNVQKTENPVSVVLSKTHPVEDGYFLDLSLPYRLGKINFVLFKDFFVDRYGINNTSFDTENQPEGQSFLSLTIETPVRPTYSNAALRDESGKINTWNIVSASKNEINLTFKKYNIIPIITTVFGVAVLAVLIFLIVTTGKKNKAVLPEGSEALLEGDENAEGEEQEYTEIENPVDEIEFDAEEVDSAEEVDVTEEAVSTEDSTEDKPEADEE